MDRLERNYAYRKSGAAIARSASHRPEI
jgi:hypothetical protein